MKRLINYSFFFLLVISLMSCLKDKDYKDGIIGHNVRSQNIVELAFPNSTSHETKKSLDIANKDTIIKLIPVRLASDAVADKDIILTLDTTLTTSYIDEHIEDVPNLEYFNSSIGSLESGLTVTIPKGSNEGYITVKVNTSKFDPLYQYVLGYSIKSISDNSYVVSGLLNSHVFLFGAKNRFDGIYRATGTMIDYANSAFTGDYPYNYYLITQGPNSVAMWDDSRFGTFIHTMKNNGAGSGYGSFAPVFTIDITTGIVTSIVNYYGQPAGNGRSVEMDPSGVNKYDFGTKTLKVKYWMNQPAVFTPHRVAFDETFTYLRPRP